MIGVIGRIDSFYSAAKEHFNLSEYYDFNTSFRSMEIEREEFIGFLEDKYQDLNNLALSEANGLFSSESTIADMYRILSVY